MGCEQSVPVQQQQASAVIGIGQTERLVSRRERLKQKETNKEDEENGVPPPKLNAAGNLMPVEVVRRTSNSIVSKDVVVGTAEMPIHIKYAYWTQRGYYPDNPHKENQDSYSISTKFAGEKNGAVLGVYDGHGEQGHLCSSFAKEKLPQNLAKYIKQMRVKKYKKYVHENNLTKTVLFDPEKWPLLTEEEYQDCCRRACLETNEAMHNNKNFEDKLSGTTAILTCFHGDMLTVCNIGDSRAVLGHKAPDGMDDEEKEEEKEEIGAELWGEDERGQKHSNLLSVPLSWDQTPYRRDERERVMKHGAAIMSIDQKEGHEKMHEDWGDVVMGEVVDIGGDPPRVWVDGKDYPGTAFTRSLGDYLGKDIGITADPEMITTKLTSDDQILIIASDGIFEFVSNTQAMEICSQATSPLMACQNLVEAAYEQWLIYENRTDDITVIVCFLQCSREPGAGTSSDLVEKMALNTRNTYSAHRGFGSKGSITNSQANETATTQNPEDSDNSSPPNSVGKADLLMQ